MGRPEEEFQPEPDSGAASYPPEEISPPAYGPSYTDEAPQPGYQDPASYPPQNDPRNQAPASYPPAVTNQQQYPPPNRTYPAQPATYPPVNPQAYPPAVKFPPASPMTAGQQQYQGPSMSPHKPYQQTGVAASGIPVQSYPQPYQAVPIGTGGWTSGLFDCMNDPTNALITAIFPCLTFGQIAEIIDNGHTTCGTSGILYGAIAFCIAMPCLLSCTYRTKLRSKYDLVEAPAPDWVSHFFCEWCALCQEYRELKARGLDPELGWQGNMAKYQNQQQQAAMMPPANQTMMG
ncbi:protein PLANT CADMIUM RESISTANCE 6-like [Aristolochia californica]|uniref:protein PLANT CADMIUM RESISTANCE 6-like n=1 Tax=Aristolochia californica TaxID=171875 RepID=UPI0035D7EE5C